MSDDPLTVIVCGSRTWSDRRPVAERLAKLWDDHPCLTVIEGGAKGADRIAGQWAAPRRMDGVAWIRMTAAWSEHHPDWCRPPCRHERRYCAGAGARRNQDMLDWLLETNGERQVLAFKADFDGSLRRGGTEDMVRRAKAAGVRGIVVRR